MFRLSISWKLRFLSMYTARVTTQLYLYDSLVITTTYLDIFLANADIIFTAHIKIVVCNIGFCAKLYPSMNGAFSMLTITALYIFPSTVVFNPILENINGHYYE